MIPFKEKSVNFYEKAKQLYLEKAKVIAGEDSKLKELLEKASSRVKSLRDNRKLNKAIEPIKIFKRMISAHRSGSYKLSSKTLGLLVLGILYFVIPMDIIPDFMPFLGFTDDISVLIAIFNLLKNEVEDFLSWEKSQIKTSENK
ncbi:hypothetical protein Belba_3280 [Belliella baltica DSM 15883]|uniref:DUF1232 domain-containing protein n=1 Tax=Belliella baltica (strain DSM 15883 / CIP 108006 / LMG 21964 / BA134) TaxID=866536 RepID=I3Z972_BELBD|nr:YkvA family protein [Belliella baltica]AFL85790.1 hypothetical protein Belba_3280 [Belliella baltica DSM 15883]